MVGLRQFLSHPRTGPWLVLLNVLLAVVLVNQLAGFRFVRWDLTEEKRYTIQPSTRQVLESIPGEVFVEVFLAGDLNPGFTRFQKAIRETLEEFRIYSGYRIQYVFTDPSQAASDQDRQEFMRYLTSQGVLALPVFETRQGQRIEKVFFPGAIISYQGQERGVMLFKANRAAAPQDVLNQAIEGIEYELALALQQITAAETPSVGWVTGHGELDSLRGAGFRAALRETYLLRDVDLRQAGDLTPALLVVAKPRLAFSEVEKYQLDQYIMRGGKVLFLLDRLEASMDSASRDDYYAFPYELNLDDQLFRYGVRINSDLVVDRLAASYPIVTSMVGGKPQLARMDWPFFPLINAYAQHPATRNLDVVVARFVSTIDTVRTPGIRKTPLFFTSPYAGRLGAPVKVSVNDLRTGKLEERFAEGPFPLAWLLEGSFSSLYRNRFPPRGVDAAHFLEKSRPTQLVVIGDGDLARNEVNLRQGRPHELGYDPVSEYTFANKELLLNVIRFMLEPDGLILARNKEIKIRPLDKERVQAERLYWQVVNLATPWALVIVVGLVLTVWRKRRFARFT